MSTEDGMEEKLREVDDLADSCYAEMEKAVQRLDEIAANAAALTSAVPVEIDDEVSIVRHIEDARVKSRV